MTALRNAGMWAAISAVSLCAAYGLALRDHLWVRWLSAAVCAVILASGRYDDPNIASAMSVLSLVIIGCIVLDMARAGVVRLFRRAALAARKTQSHA